MSSTEVPRAPLFPAVATAVHRLEDQAGRNATDCDPAHHRHHREAQAPVDSPAEDESRCAGDRQHGKRFVPHVLNHTTALRHAIG